MANTRLLKHYRFIMFNWKLPSPNRSLSQVAYRFQRVGEVIYRPLFEAETGMVIPTSFNSKHIAENVFFTSMTELERKLKTREYYKCNAELFLKYMPEICALTREREYFAEGRINDYIIQSYAFLQRHSWYISKNSFDYGLWKSEYTEYFRLFRESQRLIRSEPVGDINFGTASIRMCIESRIRSAVGILGIFSPKRHSILNVSMSDIFRALKSFGEEVEYEVSLDHIMRVYGWPNHFIHASHNTFPWLVTFAHELLRPMFMFAKYGEEHGIGGNIRMSRETHRAIRDHLMAPYLEKDPGCHIHGYAEDDCYIGRI